MQYGVQLGESDAWFHLKPQGVDLTHNLLLPTMLFAALGAMTWAIRGCSGFGGQNGCIFAGLGWAVAWWYISHDPSGRQTRRYSSAWIVPAVTIGIGISGTRGWMQWPNFFDGQLLTDAARGQYVPIPRAYGFLWLFIAGVPWAGLGACPLAWCGSIPETRLWHWPIRIACGVGGATLARYLFHRYPEHFLPLYHAIEPKYHHLRANPSLRRLINDCGSALTHLGAYLGFLLYEFLRRDWKNTILILTVGLVNGIGWAACQNWKWANHLWGHDSFNFWRCWESCGGISIGLAYGIAYFLVNRPTAVTRTFDPNLERCVMYLGLLYGLGRCVHDGLKGWLNIYRGNENYWNGVLWQVIGPAMLILILVIMVWLILRPLPRNFPGDVFPHAYALVWLVIVVQNAIAQLVTGPLTQWKETAFSIYYLLLFAITAVILIHFHRWKTAGRAGLR